MEKLDSECPTAKVVGKTWGTSGPTAVTGWNRDGTPNNMANTYDGIRRTQGRRGTPPSALVRDFSAYPFRRPTGPQWPATTFRQRSTACGQRQLANTCIAIGQNIAIGASNATTPSRNHSAANAREDASALRRLVAISQIHDGAATNNADSP
jgi:hypothetical protein